MTLFALAGAEPSLEYSMIIAVLTPYSGAVGAYYTSRLGERIAIRDQISRENGNPGQPLKPAIVVGATLLVSWFAPGWADSLRSGRPSDAELANFFVRNRTKLEQIRDIQSQSPKLTEVYFSKEDPYGARPLNVEWKRYEQVYSIARSIEGIEALWFDSENALRVRIWAREVGWFENRSRGIILLKKRPTTIVKSLENLTIQNETYEDYYLDLGNGWYAFESIEND